jgi:hypothetical protein
VGISEDGWAEFRAAVALPANATGSVRIPAILKGQVSRLKVNAYVASTSAPVSSAELDVTATLIPNGALMFLADTDVTDSRLAEFAARLAKEVGGDATAQVRICRVQVGGFPKRLEFYESFDGVVLSEGAQAATASDKKLGELLREYGDTMGLVLLLAGGQLPADIPPQREMLSFPYTYRISGETSSLFEPEPWAPSVLHALLATTAVATLLLAIVALLCVRGPGRAAVQPPQRLCAGARVCRRIVPLIPCVVGLAGLIVIGLWRIGQGAPSSRRVSFRFDRLQQYEIGRAHV